MNIRETKEQLRDVRGISCFPMNFTKSSLIKNLEATALFGYNISKTYYNPNNIIVLVFLSIMEPRPPESKESGKKKSLRKHPHEYDIEQLDLQWLPKVQELCKNTGETRTKTKYGDKTDDVDAAIRLTSTVSK